MAPAAIDTAYNEPVEATFIFTPAKNEGHLDEKYYVMQYQAGDVPLINFVYDEVPGIQVHDFRASDLNFDSHGVGIMKLKSQMTYDDFADDETIEKVYLAEIRALLGEHFSTKAVHIFEYVVRRTDRTFPVASGQELKTIQPAIVPHIADVIDRARLLFREEADSLLRKRCRVINIWKPLKGPVKDWPMAYCDPRTLDYDHDLVDVDDVFPTFVNEVIQGKFNANQKWYYAPHQMPNELMLFNQFDSENPKAPVLHCAFQPGDKPTEQLRESIEVRVVVFTD